MQLWHGSVCKGRGLRRRRRQLLRLHQLLRQTAGGTSVSNVTGSKPPDGASGNGFQVQVKRKE